MKKPSRASGASGKPKRQESALNHGSATRMLPLVRSIAGEIADNARRVAQLRPEQDYLDRFKLDLVWQERQRRYQVRDEIAACEARIEAAADELKSLGLTVLDRADGLVGFPTRVAGARAYLSWKPGEAGIGHWQFAGDAERRPLPGASTHPALVDIE